MKATWVLSAPPVPTTAFLTTVAAYSATGRPARAGAIMAAARAWPSFRVDEPLALTKVSSIAASCGRVRRRSTPPTPSNRTSSRSEKGAVSRGRDHPVGDVRQARALDDDHAPAGAAQAGVEPEDANRVRHSFAVLPERPLTDNDQGRGTATYPAHLPRFLPATRRRRAGERSDRVRGQTARWRRRYANLAAGSGMQLAAAPSSWVAEPPALAPPPPGGWLNGPARPSLGSGGAPPPSSRGGAASVGGWSLRRRRFGSHDRRSRTCCGCPRPARCRRWPFRQRYAIELKPCAEVISDRDGDGQAVDDEALAEDHPTPSKQTHVRSRVKAGAARPSVATCRRTDRTCLGWTHPPAQLSRPGCKTARRGALDASMT